MGKFQIQYLVEFGTDVRNFNTVAEFVEYLVEGQEVCLLSFYTNLKLETCRVAELFGDSHILLFVFPILFVCPGHSVKI